MPIPAIPQPESGTPLRFGEAPLAYDLQYVLILDQYQNWIDTLVWQRSNNQTWTYYQVDLSKYIGWQIKVQFGTYNDGWGGITSMFFDDVSLSACLP